MGEILNVIFKIERDCHFLTIPFQLYMINLVWLFLRKFLLTERFRVFVIYSNNIKTIRQFFHIANRIVAVYLNVPPLQPQLRKMFPTFSHTPALSFVRTYGSN